MQKKLSNKELVAAGHKFAANISADTPLIDMAKMVSELATQLDVALAAAAEAGKHHGAVMANLADMEDKLRIKQNHIKLRDTYILELEQRAEAAEAKLAELEKQEPVGTVSIAMDWNTHRNVAKVNMRPDLVVAEMKNGDELFTRPAPAIDLNAVRAEVLENVPTVCDGKEQLAFEAYASSKGLDLSKHPLHYLFLDGKTNQVRSAWRECLVYVAAQLRAGNAGKDGSHE